jgi:hypothetical protein
MRPYTSKHDIAWIIQALRERSTSLQVDESGTNVRRTTEVKEPEGGYDRSVYAVRPAVLSFSTLLMWGWGLERLPNAWRSNFVGCASNINARVLLALRKL